MYQILDMGFPTASLQLQKDVWDILLMAGFAYVFGGVQAVATGLYAAIALVKYGKSSLSTALQIAIISSVGVALVFVVFEGARAFRIIVFLLPPALISTIALHSLERYFRMPGVQAKS